MILAGHDDSAFVSRHLRILHRALLRLTYLVVFLLMTSLFLLLLSTVAMRYLLLYGVSWADEISRYLLIWISLLGSAAAVSTGDHLAFDLLLNRVAPALRAQLHQCFRGLIVLFSIFLVLQGVRLLQAFGSDGMENGILTMAWYYASVPVAGSMMAIMTTLAAILDVSDRTVSAKNP